MALGRHVNSKVAIGLGVSILAAVGAVVAVVAVGGRDGSASVEATTGEYAPISVYRPVVPKLGGGLVQDPNAGVANDLSPIMSRLPGVHRYRITITNSSSVGFINSFEWYPPIGARVMRVIGSSAGHCALGGLKGFGGNQFKTVLAHPNISCGKVNLKPPSCTCLGDGGSVAITFVADRDMPSAGRAALISATLVTEPIPSYPPAEGASQKVSESQG